jgi:hypothetical protein
LASRLELKVSPAGQRDGEALTDESNVHDENLARSLATASNKQPGENAKSNGNRSAASTQSPRAKQDDNFDSLGSASARFTRGIVLYSKPT